MHFLNLFLWQANLARNQFGHSLHCTFQVSHSIMSTFFPLSALRYNISQRVIHYLHAERSYAGLTYVKFAVFISTLFYSN